MCFGFTTKGKWLLDLGLLDSRFLVLRLITCLWRSAPWTSTNESASDIISFTTPKIPTSLLFRIDAETGGFALDSFERVIYNVVARALYLRQVPLFYVRTSSYAAVHMLLRSYSDASWLFGQIGCSEWVCRKGMAMNCRLYTWSGWAW